MPIQTILTAIDLSLKQGHRARLKPRRLPEAIADFQKDLANKLGGSTEVLLFSKGKARDRADILTQKIAGYTVIIEIDATRADQVAKKMMSRFYWAMLHQGKSLICSEESRMAGNTRVVYVSLLYPGTEKMNPEECKKYFVMGAEVLTKLNKDNIFIGYIISDRPGNDYCYCSGPQNVCGCSNTVSCNSTSANTIAPISDEKASDADLYRKYLEDHGVQSPGSIECYMQPLNIVHNNWKPNNMSSSLVHLRTVLAGLPSQPDWPNSLRKALGMTLSLGKNQISYWKKYCEYCGWRQKNNL